ncbi:DUF4148 domain-containing protein [Burkholderia sp. Ac-20353]|uniref:DUF4148 domain-containing protein n=1 Tax=Burkholderia sp. Ac-20353 TaxID=2703894 RepID=UPI00197C74F3|nr:DUF4148 domain-containing protein [Burkholderia sp. Ac-20353]MBN3786874.1 DUF4148 domain-containing protein [Burkholderia sp. Ac-20353]
MNKHLMIGVSVAAFSLAGFAVHASAQERTRAEVRQELIEAESQGLRFVTDTSYPDVSPLFRQQADQMRDHAESTESAGMGRDAAASADAGKRAIAPSTGAPATCVGPVSFCSTYFGS